MKKPLSNFQRIKKMSPEELAEEIFFIALDKKLELECSACIWYKPKYNEEIDGISKYAGDDCTFPKNADTKDCIDGIKQWLLSNEKLQ